MLFPSHSIVLCRSMHHWYIYGGLWHRHSRRFPSKKSGWTDWGNLTYYCGVYPDFRHIPYRLYSLLLLPIQRKKPFHVWHLNCCLINPIIFNSCALNSNLPIFAVLTGKTPSGVNNESAVHLPDGTWNVTNTCFIKSLILNDNGSWYEEVLTVVQYRADVVRVKFRYPENAANYVNHDMKIYVMKIPS